MKIVINLKGITNIEYWHIHKSGTIEAQGNRNSTIRIPQNHKIR